MQAMNTEKVRDSRSRTSSRRQRPKNGGSEAAELAQVNHGASFLSKRIEGFYAMIAAGGFDNRDRAQFRSNKDRQDFFVTRPGVGRGVRRTVTTSTMRITMRGHNYPVLAKTGAA